MSETRKCSRCGTELSVGMTGGGYCLGCLLQLGLDTSPDTAPESDLTEKSGDRIGPYKLIQQIGEGGCGVVYMAEQEQPIRRRVALKIIKLGMDTKSVIARFEAERQALAMMDHPNIAKVFDAGATETGRPYFVMELVRGIKITDYCDQQKLSTNHRLDLFVQVCQAIQHAHQKGIIHRDIKPSNILVTEEDGPPVPKVIDFGIAKATTDQQLSDKTLYTAFEQFIGTPAYMSPEQAGLGGLDVDTRSDIYSLGVLLYELLTGEPPFHKQEFRRCALDEVLRTIREKDPPRPSSHLATLTEQELNGVAQRRQSEPAKLPRLLRGELDWIVVKALDKDRNRRYETAVGFANDLKRFLDNKPIIARPPSNLYRFQKLISRNKPAFIGGNVAIVLLAASAIFASFFVRERQAHQRQIAIEDGKARIEQLTDSMFGFGAGIKDTNSPVTNRPAWKEGLLRQKLALQRQVYGEDSADSETLQDLVNVLLDQNRLAEAEATARQVLAADRKHLGGKPERYLRSAMQNLAWVLNKEGKLSEVEILSRKLVEVCRGPDTLTELAAILWDEKKYDEARAVYSDAQKLLRENRASELDSNGLGELESRTPNPLVLIETIQDVPSWGRMTVLNTDSNCLPRLEDGILHILIPGTPHLLSPGGYELGYYDSGSHFTTYVAFYPKINNAPRILRKVEGDFVVACKVSGDFDPGLKDDRGNYLTNAAGFADKNAFYRAGLILRDTDAHDLVFGRQAELQDGGVPNVVEHTPRIQYWINGQNVLRERAPSIGPYRTKFIWLRLKRQGDDIRAGVSADGVQWIETESIAAQFPKSIEVGIVAENGSRKPFSVEFSGFMLATNTAVFAQEAPATR
jgi:serine/threonine protein kinase/regulation of enolase protein 1 (concanavalin A-like superfamily)